MIDMYEMFVLNGKWWTPRTPDQCTKGGMSFDPFKGVILNVDSTSTQ